MSFRLLSPTRAFTSIARVAAATILTLALATIAAHAQTEWKLLDLDMESGFADSYEWPTAGSILHFLDDQRGFYYPENELSPGVRSYYGTTDGGLTWSRLPGFVPVPQRMLDATFGISSSGWLTRNAGSTWERIRPTLDQTFNYFGTAAVAGSAKHLVALSQPFENDATTGQSRPIGPNRMTISTDGGVSWMSIDSMVVETIAGTNERKLELYDSTGFGDLPAPAEMTDTFSVGWWQLYGMPDTNIATVGSVAFGRFARPASNSSMQTLAMRCKRRP
jgi:hypothetical protein